jgi:predicted RNA-binding protein with PIN domain
VPYFLDGNNLIGHGRGSSRPTEEDRSALVAEIAERLRRTKARVVLFFDGPADRHTTLGALSIRHAAGGTADDAILAEISRVRAPQEIIVVSEDRDLQRRSRERGAKALSVAEFWSRVGSSPVRQQVDRRGPVDVDEWMRYFSDDRNRKT